MLSDPLRVDDEVLTVRIENSQPVELASLTESLQAFANAHSRFAEERGVAINGDAVRLYIREIRTGSIIIDLMALAANVPIFPDQIKSLVDYAKFISESLKFFKGDAPTEPTGLKPRDVEDLTKFLTPVANDTRGTLHLTAGTVGTVNVVNYNVTSTEANAIQNRARNWLTQRAAPVHGIQRQQLFYFFQARNDAQATAGDRGIIEAISPNSVKTVFANEQAKQAMLNEALFRKAYIVDVDVQTINGRPRLYRIMEVTDTLDRE